MFDDFASDLVRLKVDVIVATNPNAVSSAKRATTKIPIIMMHTPDQVQLGFVASLARPGGNITGVTTLSADLTVKQIELLKTVVPRTSRIALLWNPDNPWHPHTGKALQGSSGSMALQLQVLKLRGPDASAGAFGDDKGRHSGDPGLGRSDDVLSSPSAGGPGNTTSAAYDGWPPGLCGSGVPDVVLGGYNKR